MHTPNRTHIEQRLDFFRAVKISCKKFISFTLNICFKKIQFVTTEAGYNIVLYITFYYIFSEQKIGLLLNREFSLMSFRCRPACLGLTEAWYRTVHGECAYRKNKYKLAGF